MLRIFSDDYLPSYSVSYLFTSFLYIFQIGLFLFLLLSVEYFILDTSLLSDMCLANIFSQAVACVWVLLAVSFIEPKF